MNTEHTQQVDVIIPVYNGARFIIDAITSVETQTHKPEKIIVVNDGSTDDTERVILDYKNTCSVPIMYINQTNGGPNSARNTGINASTAPLLAFLDADDVWSPEKLGQQLAVLAQSNAGLVYCDYQTIDERGVVTDNKRVFLDRTIKGSVYEKVLSANKIVGSSSAVLIPRTVFDSVGMFDETIRFGEDWDMWIRIAKVYQIDFADEVLVSIRKHRENSTSNPLNYFTGELLFYKKWVLIVDTVPVSWPDRVLFKVLKRFPKTDFLRSLTTTLPYATRKKLFNRSLGFMCLHAFGFITRYSIKILFKKNI